MSTPAAKMFVLVGKGAACIRISGRANFGSSVDFKRLLSELLDRGYLSFVLDLAECVLMDSTFLGVLAGLGLRLRREGGPPRIELVNVSTRVGELLENLGVLHLFKVSEGQATSPDGAEQQEMVCTEASREEVTRASLEAHETLMSIDPANVTRFKDVTQFLAEDIERLKRL